jgi:hypothetical protein
MRIEIRELRGRQRESKEGNRGGEEELSLPSLEGL